MVERAQIHTVVKTQAVIAAIFFDAKANRADFFVIDVNAGGVGSGYGDNAVLS